LIIAGSVAGTVVVTIYILILWALSKLITIIGSIVLGIAFILLLVRFACYFAVFPGSIMLWRKWLEGYFRKEIALQIFHRVNELKVGVDAIVHKTTTEYSISEVMISTKRLISSLSSNLGRLEANEDISIQQQKLLHFVDELKTSLIEARVMFGEGDE
jgi:energy-coupling factor transporter transmembrane protein EcfT